MGIKNYFFLLFTCTLNLVGMALEIYVNQTSNPALVSLLYLPGIFYNSVIDVIYFNVWPDYNEAFTITTIVSVNIIWLVYRFCEESKQIQERKSDIKTN